MPFDLLLARKHRDAGWRVKIYDNETGLEDPHITIMRRLTRWRVSLRDGRYMDREPDPSDIPSDLDAHIEQAWNQLRAEWNRMHPGNPV